MARVVSHGPDGRQLCATYKEADKLDYQDSLGRLVLEVVRVVPDGVLLFLPSYVLMDKLRDRWKVRELSGANDNHPLLLQAMFAARQHNTAISLHFTAALPSCTSVCRRLVCGLKLSV